MGVGYPLKIPYIIGHTVHRQGHFPRRQAAGNDRLRESRGNGWHTDFGTKSSVLYPSRRGTGEITNWPQPVRDFDRTEKEEREVSVSTPLGRTFSESRGGDFPLPRPQTTTKEEQRWLMPFYDLPSGRAVLPRPLLPTMSGQRKPRGSPRPRARSSQCDSPTSVR